MLVGGGGGVQPAKPLPHKPENLDSRPRTHIKADSAACATLERTLRQEAETEDLSRHSLGHKVWNTYDSSRNKREPVSTQ